jgi:hypothetical protein
LDIPVVDEEGGDVQRLREHRVVIAGFVEYFAEFIAEF